VAADQQRRHPGTAITGQHEIQARRGRADEVGKVKHALPGSVVAAQADDVQARIVRGELPQVRGVLSYLLTLPGHGFYWFQLPDPASWTPGRADQEHAEAGAFGWQS
jgi:hypothetical protein